MEHVIIDTNIPLKAANCNPEDEIDRQCSLQCLYFLRKLMDYNNTSIVVIDSGWEVLKEYKNNIKETDRTVASEFLFWVLTNRANRIAEFSIKKDEEGNYSDFPESVELEGFDRSDRKFVALAIVDPQNPTIYNGSDTDWWIYKDALKKEGIKIHFLCEEYMRAKCKVY